MTDTIYIDDLGNKHPIKDKDTIIWFWEQRIKLYNKQNAKTRYWLNLLESLERRLIRLQAFELLYFLKSKVTAEQMNNRHAQRAIAKAKAQLEWDSMQDWYTNYKLKVELTTIKNLN
jgi:hypothetical protein